MSNTLRKRLIRLARRKPELRNQLLPLLRGKEAGMENILSPGDSSGTPVDVIEFLHDIERVVKQQFPRGYFVSRASKKFGHYAIYIATATLPKGKQKGGIIQNDPAYQTFWMFNSYTPEGGLNPKVKVEMSEGGRLYLNGEAQKIGWRGKTGSPAQIVAHFARYYAKLRKMIDAQPRMASHTHLRPPTKKVAAGKPVLERAGLNARAVKKGMGAMLYMIDPAGNHSKFYEMLIVPEGDGYKLMRRWGALTDSGSTGRVDKRDEFHETLVNAQKSLLRIYKAKTRKGYVDAWKHKGPKGQYPVGLTRSVGFGWGTQTEAFCIPSLRSLQDHLTTAQAYARRADMAGVEDTFELAEVDIRALRKSDSTMARKIEKNLAHMEARIPGILEGDSPRNLTTALSRLISYLEKQLSVCHARTAKRAARHEQIPGYDQSTGDFIDRTSGFLRFSIQVDEDVLRDEVRAGDMGDKHAIKRLQESGISDLLGYTPHKITQILKDRAYKNIERMFGGDIYISRSRGSKDEVTRKMKNWADVKKANQIIERNYIGGEDMVDPGVDFVTVNKFRLYPGDEYDEHYVWGHASRSLGDIDDWLKEFKPGRGASLRRNRSKR